jgi:hypothetical protein
MTKTKLSEFDKLHSMFRLLNFLLLGISTLTLLACEKSVASVSSVEVVKESAVTIVDVKDKPTQVTKSASSSKPVFETIEWVDLIPTDDLDALQNPPSYLADLEDGSFEDQITNQLKNDLPDSKIDRYQQALVSTNIISTMDKRSIRLPGFVVPVEFDDEQTITEFFLVPYFGACIHTPPPPPNQIIYVHAPQGLNLEYLYDPFWISGTMQTTTVQNTMATAAYSLQMQSYEAYTE